MTFSVVMQGYLKTLFAAPSDPVTPWSAVWWWESRRIAYNIIIGCYSIFCLCIFFWAISTSGELEAGEDAVEPMALIIAPFLVNLAYTLGWIVEAPLRLVKPDLPATFGPMLFKSGLIFSVFIISVPAVVWAAIRLFQILGFIK